MGHETKLAKRNRYNSAIKRDGEKLVIFQSLTTGISVKVVHETPHYIVVKREGSSYWRAGDTRWIAGNVEVREKLSSGDPEKFSYVGKAVVRDTLDRKWRTTVKAAVAKATELELAWAEMNAGRRRG